MAALVGEISMDQFSKPIDVADPGIAQLVVYWLYLDKVLATGHRVAPVIS